MHNTPETFLSRYATALATQRWEEVEPLIHANASVTFSNGAVHKGLDAVKAAYSKNFSLIQNEEYRMSDVHWVVKTPVMAVYLFRFDWKGIIHGQPASGKGRGTAAIIQEDGEWKLVVEHLGREME